MKKDILAFDKATVRKIDQDGKLHIAISHITKAMVCPYFGHEIPNYQALGLDANTVYNLLRGPQELEKAAHTFNKLPILSTHKAVFVGQTDQEFKPYVIGFSGDDSVYNAPYVDNSLVIFDSVAIAAIEQSAQKEISCGYRYVPIMKSGSYDGMSYDGVMTDIVGNHIAIVESGRAGSDVVVGDKNPFLEAFDMSKTSRKAVAVKAGLSAFLMPVLAADASIDLKKIVGLPKAKTIESDADRIANAIVLATKDKLAKDAAIDPVLLKKVILLAADAESDKEMDEKEQVAKDSDKRDDETDEEYKARMAKDNYDEDKDDDKVSKTAMDSALAAAVQAERQHQLAIRQAEKDVHHVVGDIVAQDSAEAVYKLALDAKGVDLTGVDKSAYRALFKAVCTVGETSKPKLAQDSAVSSGAFAELFPSAAKVKVRG